MGALYEDVERFFGDIFASYGRMVARFPLAFISVSVITCALFGLGILNLRYEYHVGRLYAPMESQALTDQARLLDLFPDHSGDDFYPRQAVTSNSYGSVVVTTTMPGDNLLVSPTFDELLELYTTVLNLSYVYNGETFTYADVCARRNGHCVVEGADLIDRHLHDNCYAKHHESIETYVYELEPQGGVHMGDEDWDLTLNNSDSATAQHCAHAQTLRLRFFLRQNASDIEAVGGRGGDTDEDRREGVLLWEYHFLRAMRDATKRVHLCTLSYTVSDSFDVELYEHAGQDIRLLPAAVGVMALFAMAVGSGGNWVSTHMVIAQVGLVAVLLAVTAAFGMLGLMGIPFVDICSVTPFLVLGIGMEGTFLLLSAWRQTNIRASVQERLADTFRQAALSITIMALTDLLVFCIGATSPFLSIRSFCACSGISLLFCYINQLTFFGGCLVLNARRAGASRHCVTCLKTRPRRELREEGRHPLRVLLCGGHTSRRAGDDDNLCKQLPNHLYPRLIMQSVVKALVLLAYFAYIGLSVWGIYHLQIGFRLEEVVPEESYLTRYIMDERQYSNATGPVVMFVIDKPISYERYEAQVHITQMLYQARMSPFINHTRTTSWLDEYIKFLRQTTGAYNPHNFISKLANEFLKAYPKYRNDILFNEHRTVILASRFYVYAHKLLNSSVEKNFLESMREIGKNATLPVTVYSPSFVFFEHHVSILKNTLLTVTVTIISMLLIALMFIPHPVAVMCVTVSMLSVVLGMLGLLSLFGLTLNAIKTTQVLLSVGLCSNFTVHLSHSFMTATGKSRNDRVRAALEKVGGIIVREAFVLFLGISLLAFGSSYLFTSFFACMLVVVVVGLFHSLAILPVLLSFVGPRRTGRAKMFIPVSPSSRSIGSDFSAHIYSTPSSRNGDTTSQADSEMVRSNTETSNPISDIIDGSNLGLRLSYDPMEAPAIQELPTGGAGYERQGYDRIPDAPVVV